jgi:dihydrodipicolinate synthase/N-acetylneuraminate lyase
VKTLESWTPRRGVSVPCVTVLGADGSVLEDDQRRLVRYLIQGGRGADVIFAMGTNGEWNRLDQPRRQQVIRVVIEEVRKQNPRLEHAGNPPVEAWAGVTAPGRKETLENLEFAIAAGAHAAVLAPLAIADVGDPLRFVSRDVADLLDARERRIPVFLYDNIEIAAGRERRIRTRWVKQWSRLDFVRGIKVSATPRQLGHYTKAARQFRDVGAFSIYVGNALYILEMMRPRGGLLGALVEHWNRFLLHDLLPAGVVSGPANLLPREWQRAWQVSCAGDVERMDEMKRLFERFREACSFPSGRPTLACLKRGLLALGVISSDAVASGTRALARDEAERFDAALERLRGEIEAALPAHWCSDPTEAGIR